MLESRSNSEKRKGRGKATGYGKGNTFFSSRRGKGVGTSRAVKIGKRMWQSMKDVVYLKSIQGGSNMPLQEIHVVNEE